jgi:Protein of unknown function (DUF4089)
MDNQAALNYVKATAVALDLPLDETRALQVAQILSRTAMMARALDQVPMATDHELAQIYCPAPFPMLAAAAAATTASRAANDRQAPQ